MRRYVMQCAVYLRISEGARRSHLWSPKNRAGAEAGDAQALRIIMAARYVIHCESNNRETSRCSTTEQQWSLHEKSVKFSGLRVLRARLSRRTQPASGLTWRILGLLTWTNYFFCLNSKLTRPSPVHLKNSRVPSFVSVLYCEMAVVRASTSSREATADILGGAF